MKNEMIKLGGFRKIYDLITDWSDSHNRKVYADFDVDSDKVYLSLNSQDYGATIDNEAISKIEELFLNGAKLVDRAVDIRVYELGELPYTFNVTTIELLKYATDNGFVVDDFDLNTMNGDILIDFIKDNPTFIIKANADSEDGGVIIE